MSVELLLGGLPLSARGSLASVVLFRRLMRLGCAALLRTTLGCWGGRTAQGQLLALGRELYGWLDGRRAGCSGCGLD